MKKRPKIKGSSSHRKINLAIYALAFLIILIIFGKFFKFVFSLNQPITPQYALANTAWNGQTTINIILKSNDISVLSLDPDDKDLTIISLPSDAYIQLPKGYGSWPISSIFSLGQEEKVGQGAILLKESISTLLGLPIDRIIEITGSDSKMDSHQLVDKLHKNWFQILSLSKAVKTDMTVFETWNFVSTVNQIRADKTSFLSLADSNITQSQLLPDSTRVLGIDTIRLDLFIRDKLTDPKIVKEGLSIAFFNGTIHPGLAVDASRIATNLGANVITTANTDSTFQKSTIIAMNGDKQELLKTYTYTKLAWLFASECQTKSCQIDDPKIAASRAQIIVVLGEDYYLRNYQHN